MSTSAVERERVFSPAALRAARVAADKSQREVGEAIGRRYDTISMWELGRFSPTADDLAAVAWFLGVDVIEFFPFSSGDDVMPIVRAVVLAPKGNISGNVVWGNIGHHNDHGQSAQCWRPEDFPFRPTRNQLGLFRSRGYWASCFPEGDGLTFRPERGQELAMMEQDVSECFGLDTGRKLRDLPSCPGCFPGRRAA